MRYLKPFNEDITSFSFEEELKDFCETNLAYLLDEGIEVNVILGERGNTNLTDFERYLIRIMIKEDKSWNEIKDQMIPFLTRLSRKYEIGLRTPSSRMDLGLSSLVLNTITEDDIRFIYFGEDDKAKVMNDKVNNMINDETSNWSGYRGEIKLHEIRLYICGYKQEPKKSVLTKIKSFFK